MAINDEAMQVLKTPDKHYRLARYICPTCSLRYGEPAKDKVMDIVNCDKCVVLKHEIMTTPGKRGSKYYNG